ncbi:MAG: matrixin family metalloprotease [Moraxellaceae bacterium]|nr:matrixin family metalloprotease [Moraxellaceae bacterium]
MLDALVLQVSSVSDVSALARQEVVFKKPDSENNALDIKDYGVCFVLQERYSEETNNAYYGLGLSSYVAFLLPDVQSKIDRDDMSQEDWLWLEDWSDSLRVKVLKAPVHGHISGFEGVSTNDFRDFGDFKYFPNKGYSGRDAVEFFIEGENQSGVIVGMKLKYFISVLGSEEYKKYAGVLSQSSMMQGDKMYRDAMKELCGFRSDFWRIPTSTPIRTDADDILGQLSFDEFLSSPSQVTFTLADLPGQSLGLTSGTSLTLDSSTDTNGAGHGWYFDWLGSADDWLPTSHPQEWMARPGSAADGRMDFLTVFFHEYGHALGLEHSHDAHDLMATTLTPGVRRLPSPDDMALFAAVNTLAEAGGDTPQPYSQPSPDHC